MTHSKFTIRIDNKTLTEVTRLSKRIGYSRNATISFLLREAISRREEIISAAFGVRK